MFLETSEIVPPNFPMLLCPGNFLFFLITPWKFLIFIKNPLEIFDSIPPGEIRLPPCMDKEWNGPLYKSKLETFYIYVIKVLTR